MSKPPIDYLRMLHYDTCVYDPDTLADLVRIVGAERIVMGSDYPVGDMTPAAVRARLYGARCGGKELVLQETRRGSRSRHSGRA